MAKAMHEVGRTNRRYSLWAEALWRLLFPPRCLFCSCVLPAAAEIYLCSRCSCWEPGSGFLCLGCGGVYREQPSCTCPQPGPPPLQGLYFLAFYEDKWREVLLRLKYRGERRLSRPLGRWLGSVLREAGRWQIDAVTPVPLAAAKERRRGYNQAYLLARQIAAILERPLLPLLRKTRDTLSQTGLSRVERRENVAGSFALAALPPPRGQSILLVDDIYTTGATMREAAYTLYRHGATVYGAVVAYQSRRER